MNKHDFIEGTAAGLRKMNETPSHLLIRSDSFGEWEFDELQLLGIPVIKTYIPVCVGYGGVEYPVIPCFKDIPEHKMNMEVYYFQRGFHDKVGGL